MNKGFCEIPIDKLVKAGWNYKENNQELAEKLSNNIKRNGQIENIIVRELETGFYEVVNGNHRLDVLKELGFETVYSFNLGDISEAQAKRIAVETNETKFESSEKLLKGIMKEINNEFDIDDLLLTMPFSEDYILSVDVDNMDNIKEPSSNQKEPEVFDGFVVVIKATHDSMSEIEEYLEEWKKKYGLEINIS